MLLLLLLSILVFVRAGYSSTLSIVRESPWQHQVVPGVHPNAALVATFNNSVNETGWSHLEIHGNRLLNTNEEMAYMAGYAEGIHTGELIYMSYVNTLGVFCENSTNFCDRLEAFLDKNLDFLKGSIAQNPKSSYWRQVNLYLKQLQGLEDGYYANDRLLPPLPKYAFQFIQYNSDIEDLQEAFAIQDNDPSARPHRMLGEGHCSALIKVLPNNEDLLTSHDTWTDYHTMLRVYKLYDLPYTDTDGKTIPGSSIAFSSYPGKLQSEDDYYIINTGLVTMETTNDMMNSSLWNVISPQCVLEPIRVMIANRLASTGEEWCKTVSLYNSGTYNNQWMIVDYNRFVPHQPLPSSDLLWVLEQIPGKVVYDDQTQTLVSKSYWASYNIPYYPEIFELAGYSDAVSRYGNFFSHDQAPRALIFARNQSQITDMDSFIALMRYNNFEHDPLSACNCTPPYSAENAISARCDLNSPQGKYPIDVLGHRRHGGTDNKVTNAQMVKTLSCLATCGPTHSQQPVFRWSTSGFQRTPLGHPDSFDFSPVLIKWDKINN